MTCLSAEISSQPGLKDSVKALEDVVSTWVSISTAVTSEEGTGFYLQIHCVEECKSVCAFHFSGIDIEFCID